MTFLIARNQAKSCEDRTVFLEILRYLSISAAAVIGVGTSITSVRAETVPVRVSWEFGKYSIAPGAIYLNICNNSSQNINEIGGCRIIDVANEKVNDDEINSSRTVKLERYRSYRACLVADNLPEYKSYISLSSHYTVIAGKLGRWIACKTIKADKSETRYPIPFFFSRNDLKFWRSNP
jgi:hypothetical protein